MSKYTTELRYVCESLTGLEESVGDNDMEDVIKKARPIIFNFEYPIFEVSYRNVLENKIIEHFYFREIGYETYGLWHSRLRMKMREIMPYYNKLYESEKFVQDPLRNYDITKVHDGEFDKARILDMNGRDTDSYTGSDTDIYSGTDTESYTGSDTKTLSGDDAVKLTGRDSVVSSGDDEVTLSGTDEVTLSGEDTVDRDLTNAHGDAWTLFSDTPQGGLDGIENATDDIKSNAYLTNATRVIDDKSSSESETTDYGKIETTDYGKVATTEYGRTDTTNYGKIETTEYGKEEELAYDHDITTEYDKSIEHEKNTTIDKIKNQTDDERANGTDHALDRIYGYRDIDPNKFLAEYRKNLLNIDMMIINELEELFMQLW